MGIRRIIQFVFIFGFKRVNIIPGQSERKSLTLRIVFSSKHNKILLPTLGMEDGTHMLY